MLRKATAVIFICCASLMIGCSSDDDNDEAIADPDEQTSEEAGEGTENDVVAGEIFRISITNLSPAQPMTPPVVAIHDVGTHIFQLGELAEEGVQMVAEDGNSELLVDLVTLDSTVSASGIATAEEPGAFEPGETATIVLETEATDQVLSIINMVVCTNDAFTGVDSMVLPVDDTPISQTAVYYDAGTEVNVLDADYWVMPCGGSGENLHEDEGGVIAVHDGQTGTGDFDFIGTEPAVSITVERLEATDGTFDFAFTNNSLGQPLSPAVVAIHDPSVSVFTIGQEASAELRDIAENGRTESMIALVNSLQEVSASGQVVVGSNNNGLLFPGETATLTLQTDAASHVFSAVNMVVCANDGFTGADSIALPKADETITILALPYDAGTESNTHDANHRVPFCGGNGHNLHEEESAVTAVHAGQSEAGNFSFSGSEPIMTISVTRRSTGID